MEGVAAAGSVITILQITEEIGRLCRRYIHEVRHAQRDIHRLQSKASALHKVLTRLNNEPHSNIDATAVQKCCKDLSSIQERLKPKTKHTPMKRVGFRALKWPFSSKEVEEQTQALEGYLIIFNTTLQLNMSEKVGDAEQERLLEKLAYAGDALFNSYENDQRHRLCLENTRVDILQQIMDWADDISPQCIFWLKGLAGTGKSTIATTVAFRLKAKSSRIASYFFKRGHSDLAHVRKLIPTIVRQLSQYSSLYRQSVLAAIKEEPGIGQSNLREQFEKLLVEPLRRLRPVNLAQDPFFIIMDALDECDEQRDLRMLLRLLAKTEDIPTLRLKILITSRPELPIRHGFEEIPSIFHRNLALQNVPRPVVDSDIKIFLSHELKDIQDEFRLPADWLTDVDLETLARKAGGIFIFAATACRYIGGSSQAKPQERLKQICSSAATNQLATEELDQMYAMILQNSIKGRYTEEERQNARVRFHYIVGSIVLLLNPLSIAQLSSLLSGSHVESQQELEGVLQRLHAVIDVPEDAGSPVQSLHLSFRDFLLDPNRCLDRQFWVDEQQAHQTLALDCTRLLSSSLHRNMCRLQSPGTLNFESDHTTVENALSPAMHYACRHWADHAHRGKMAVDDHGCIHRFLQQHFLHWVESMSWMGRVSEAVIVVTNLTAMTDHQAAPLAHDFIHDCRRFVMAFRPAIEQAPEQVYGSALVFSPLQSIVRQNFRGIIPRWVRLRPHPHGKWGSSLQTLECDYIVDRVNFLPGGKLLATHGLSYFPKSPRSYENYVRQRLDIWDQQTGGCQSHLKASPQESSMDNLSPDGNLVFSVSADGTRSLWDIAKSEHRFILEKHPSRIITTEFSFNSQFLALGSADGSIQLLDTHKGRCHCDLKGHSDEIVDLVFSPDCKLVAASAGNMTRLWNVQTGSHRFAIEYPSRSYSTQRVVFSPDSKLLASGSGNNAIRLWDIVTGMCRFSFEGHSNHFGERRFSPDGELLASGSYDDTVRLWDMRTGGCRATLRGGGRRMAFSPDGQLLALGGCSGFVRLWSVPKQEYCSILDGHASTTNAVCFSPDGRFLASASDDCIVRLFDLHMDMGDYSPSLESQSTPDHLYNVTFSPNGKLVASESGSGKIRLWNSETGDCCFDYEGESVSFSSDGQLVVSTSIDGVRILDVRTENYRFFPKKGYLHVLSPDGQLAASVASGHSIQLWNIQTGDNLFTLKGHSNEITTLVFSPTGNLIASGSNTGSDTGSEKISDKTALLWDTQTGELISTFADYCDFLDTMVFAPNSELLALGSHFDDSGLRLWDVLAGCIRFNLGGHTGRLGSFSPKSRRVVFSPNSQLVAVGSFDRIVRLWDTQTGKLLLTIPYLSLESRIEFLTGIDGIFVDGMVHEIGSTKMTKTEIANHNRLLSGFQILSSGDWVTKYSERVLWIPPERRGSSYAVCGEKIVIGAENRRLTFLNFEDEPSRQGTDD